MKFPVIITMLIVICFIGCAPHYANFSTRQKWINDHPEITLHHRNLIMQGKVCLGMTTEEVITSWGHPTRMNNTVGSWGKHEQWVYRSSYGYYAKYLYFENGLLTSWQD